MTNQVLLFLILGLWRTFEKLKYVHPALKTQLNFVFNFFSIIGLWRKIEKRGKHVQQEK